MRKLTIFVVIIVLLAFGGTAVAAMGSDSGNTYTGCLNGGGNILKVAIGDQPTQPCADDQLQISWNAEGPQGPPGDSGLSKGYSTSKGNVDLILEPNEAPKQVMVLTLPAGDYISNITIGASYYPYGLYPKDEHAFLECHVEENGNPVSGTATTLQGLETTAVTFPIHLDEEGDVITYCYVGYIGDDTQSITINSGYWTAIQVDDLDQQTPLYIESK